MPKKLNLNLSLGKKNTAINQGAITREEVIMRARSFQPGTPGVNIMPKAVLEEYRVESLRTRFLATGATLLVGFGALFGASAIFNFAQHPDLDNVLAQTEEVNARSQSLASYQQFFSAVDQKRQAVGGMLVSDINMGDATSLIQNAAVQSGVSLTTVSISAPRLSAEGAAAADAPGASCPSPDPFGAVSTAGCISFSGIAGDRESIGRFVDILNTTPGLVNAYVPTTTVGGDEGVTQSQVTGTVSFTQELYSGKYNPLTLPLSSVLTFQEAPVDAGTTEVEAGEDGQ